MDLRVFVITVDGPIRRTDIPALCDRFRELLDDAGPGRVVCDVGALVVADATTVDALARLQLVARRMGREVRLSRASPGLVELLSLTGLLGIVPVDGPLGVEARGQPEQREERRSVEKERDPDDLAI